ncbi:MAG: sulfite reductase subunit alpha, partial [Planctomycetota bacterium]
MQENAPQLFAWLERGAVFYVCGDASRMAIDVDLTLRAIVQTEGGMNESQAAEYVERMTREGRYHRDVY